MQDLCFADRFKNNWIRVRVYNTSRHTRQLRHLNTPREIPINSFLCPKKLYLLLNALRSSHSNYRHIAFRKGCGHFFRAKKKRKNDVNKRDFRKRNVGQDATRISRQGFPAEQKGRRQLSNIEWPVACLLHSRNSGRCVPKTGLRKRRFLWLPRRAWRATCA